MMRPVRVERPNPQYANLMQEQLGGCNGELKAAMQYLSQSFRIKDPGIKNLIFDFVGPTRASISFVLPISVIYTKKGGDR